MPRFTWLVRDRAEMTRLSMVHHHPGIKSKSRGMALASDHAPARLQPVTVCNTQNPFCHCLALDPSSYNIVVS